MILALAALATAACADLQQSAPRQTMQVILRPDANALVRETRRMPVKDEPASSERSVAFEQGDARIVPGSLQLVPPPGLHIERSSVPGDMQNGLVWELSGRMSGNDPLTVAYELEGLEWKPRYALQLDPDTVHAGLQAALELTNKSNLDLWGAQISLDLEESATNERVDRPAQLHVDPPALDLPNGWTKTVRLQAARPSLMAEIPTDIVYRYEPEVHREGVHRLVTIDCTETPQRRAFLASLPSGPMSVYIMDDGESGHLPVAMAQCDFAKSDKYEDEPLAVDLGAFREVTVERTKLQMQRTNLDFDRLGRVSGSDIVETWRLTAENGTAKAVRIQLRQSLLDNWELSSDVERVMLDDYTAQWTVEVEPRASREIIYTITRHEGTRAD